jgi:TldD protein
LPFTTVASNGEVMQIGHKSLGGVNGFEVVEDADLEAFATGISQKAISLLDAKTPPSGDFPVILDPELAGVFIHEALGHASEADIILLYAHMPESRSFTSFFLGCPDMPGLCRV